MIWKEFCTQVQQCDAKTNDEGLNNVAGIIASLYICPQLPSYRRLSRCNAVELDVKLARNIMAWEHERTHVLSELQT